MSGGGVNGAPHRQCMASVSGTLRVQHLPGVCLAFQGFIPLFSSFKVPTALIEGQWRKERTTKTLCWFQPPHSLTAPPSEPFCDSTHPQQSQTSAVDFSQLHRQGKLDPSDCTPPGFRAQGELFLFVQSPNLHTKPNENLHVPLVCSDPRCGSNKTQNSVSPPQARLKELTCIHPFLLHPLSPSGTC